MGCCETKSVPNTSQLSSSSSNETPAIIRSETPEPIQKPVSKHLPSKKEVQREDLSTEIKKIGNGIILDLEIYKNIPDGESVYLNYIKMRKMKEDREKGKIIQLSDDDDDEEEILKSEVEMRKTYYTYGVIYNDNTHICLTIGKPNDMKIMFVPGKLNRNYDIKIINFATKEHLLLWLYEGEINQKDIHRFIKKKFKSSVCKINIQIKQCNGWNICYRYCKQIMRFIDMAFLCQALILFIHCLLIYIIRLYNLIIVYQYPYFLKYYTNMYKRHLLYSFYLFH
jgi:hypothetical protein